MRLVLRSASLALLLALVSNSAAHATWSVAAVDRSTGEIGVAGASCTYNVQGIGEVVPGKGAVVVQAMSNDDAREQGLKFLRDGASSEQIIRAMRHEKFDPENQQYSVILLAEDQPQSTYSGKLISGWFGQASGDDVVVIGNTLASETVVTSALAAFRAAKGKRLAERLTAALVAGADAGGDKRCGEQHATSAFVTVYKPDDNPRFPYFHLVVYGIDKGELPAVTKLQQEFQRWLATGTDQTSTRTYVIP